MSTKQAKFWYVSGIVQGVGFRYFVRNHAHSLKLTGWARNLDDGRVEVFAVGTPGSLDDLASAIHKGPPHAQVRTVEEKEANPETRPNFEVL